MGESGGGVGVGDCGGVTEGGGDDCFCCCCELLFGFCIEGFFEEEGGLGGRDGGLVGGVVLVSDGLPIFCFFFFSFRSEEDLVRIEMLNGSTELQFVGFCVIVVDGDCVGELST